MLDYTGRNACCRAASITHSAIWEFWFNPMFLPVWQDDPFKSLLAAQRIGNIKPEGPVYLRTTVGIHLARIRHLLARARDWCAMGADVKLWTNEQPPLFNKLTSTTCYSHLSTVSEAWPG